MHIKYSSDELKHMAREIADMRYDDMSYLLGTLSDMLVLDADKDRERNRPKLAETCESASVLISNASVDLEEAWRISEPFMKE